MHYSTSMEGYWAIDRHWVLLQCSLVKATERERESTSRLAASGYVMTLSLILGGKLGQWHSLPSALPSPFPISTPLSTVAVYMISHLP